jgi:hypothetical protein
LIFFLWLVEEEESPVVGVDDEIEDSVDNSTTTATITTSSDNFTLRNDPSGAGPQVARRVMTIFDKRNEQDKQSSVATSTMTSASSRTMTASATAPTNFAAQLEPSPVTARSLLLLKPSSTSSLSPRLTPNRPSNVSLSELLAREKKRQTQPSRGLVLPTTTTTKEPTAAIRHSSTPSSSTLSHLSTSIEAHTAQEHVVETVANIEEEEDVFADFEDQSTTTTDSTKRPREHDMSVDDDSNIIKKAKL